MPRRSYKRRKPRFTRKRKSYRKLKKYFNILKTRGGYKRKGRLIKRRKVKTTVSKYTYKVIDGLFQTPAGAGFVNTYQPDGLGNSIYPMIPINVNNTNIQAVNLIHQGAGINKRIGTKIALKEINLKLQARQNPTFTATLDNTRARILLVYDRQPNKSVTYPTTNVILGSASSQRDMTGGSLYGTWIENIAVENLEQYIVIMDELITLPAQNNVQAQQIIKPPYDNKMFILNKKVPLNNLETIFTTSTGTITDIETGALYLIVMSKMPTANTPWLLNGTYRLKYKET